MKFSKIAMALLVSSVIFTGCGSDSDGNGDEKTSPTATATPTPTHNTQAEGSSEQTNGGSSSGTSKYLKFDEEFLSERESAGDRYYMVTCESVGYSYNDVDYGDIASYEYNSNMVGSGESLGLKVSIKNGKFFIGELYNLKIIGDYGDYVVVQTGWKDNYDMDTYNYWYPKPIDSNNNIESAFSGRGESYMDNIAFRFKHQGRCTPNSLNEHLADWKSKQ